MALSLSVSLSLPRCSNHGQCRVAGEAQWECRCYEGWDGPDCGVPLEQNCADNKDNDKGDATLSPTPLGSIFIAQIYWNRDSCTLPLQTAWWTARTRNAAKTRPVAWASCAWAHPSQLTFSCASNRPLSLPLSSSAWNSSSTRAACRTMLAWRRSTKGMLCRQSIAHKFSVCDSNFTALGGSEVKCLRRRRRRMWWRCCKYEDEKDEKLKPEWGCKLFQVLCSSRGNLLAVRRKDWILQISTVYLVVVVNIIGLWIQSTDAAIYIFLYIHYYKYVVPPCNFPPVFIYIYIYIYVSLSITYINYPFFYHNMFKYLR